MLKNICTIYDIELSVPELYSIENDYYIEPLGALLDTVVNQSGILFQKLQPYFNTAALTVTTYLTYPVNRRDNSNKNANLRKPTLLVTDSTTKECQTYVVTFTDSTNYTITTVEGEAQGTGSTGTDATTTDAFVKIESAKWLGTFAAGDKFIFAYETYEHTLRTLCAYMVGCKLLKGRYVSEAANSMVGIQMNYCNEWAKMLTEIINADTELEGNTEGYRPPDSRESWLGYNVDEKGLLQDAPTE